MDDKALLSDVPCDMCRGEGMESYYVDEHGKKILVAFDQILDFDFSDHETKRFACTTCKGTGILPMYLRPEYIKMQMENDARRKSVFSWIRRIIGRSLTGRAKKGK